MRIFKKKGLEIVILSVLTVVSTSLPALMTHRMWTIVIIVQSTPIFMILDQTKIVILPIK